MALLIVAAQTSMAKPMPQLQALRSSETTLSTRAGVFSSLQVHRKEKGAALAWTVSVPDVTEFIIERSYDGTYFETLDHVTPPTRGRGQYVDNSVWPGYIYYRVKAVLPDGTVDESETVMVRIVSRH